MQFRFKDKEKPRNYTCSLASLLHVSKTIYFSTFIYYIENVARCLVYSMLPHCAGPGKNIKYFCTFITRRTFCNLI